MNRRHTATWVAMLTAVVLCATPAWAQSEVGTLAAVGGAPQVQRAGGWQDATRGSPVFIGDRIRTEASDSAKIVFQDDSVLDVAPNTEFTVNKQAFDPSARRFATLLRLVKGKVRAWVSDYYRQPHARYEIETPTAIAGVRGTEFVILYDPKAEVTEVVGLAGVVDVTGKLAVLGGTVQVEARFVSRVEKGHFPTAPQQLDEGQMQQYLSGLDILGTGRPDGLNVDHYAASGQLLSPQDVPSDIAQRAGAVNGPQAGAPPGFLAARRSADIATNTQPLLDYQNTPPGRVPVGGVRVGF
jgi:hypothetical protein